MSFSITNHPYRPSYSTSTSEDSKSISEDSTSTHQDLLSTSEYFTSNGEFDIETETICNEAYQLAWKHKFLESAKLYFQVFERKTTLENSRVLKDVIWNYFQQDPHRAIYFNFKEINIIKHACKVVLNYDSKAETANILLKHLNIKTSHLTDLAPYYINETLIDISDRYSF